MIGHYLIDLAVEVVSGRIVNPATSNVERESRASVAGRRTTAAPKQHAISKDADVLPVPDDDNMMPGI